MEDRILRLEQEIQALKTAKSRAFANIPIFKHEIEVKIRIEEHIQANHPVITAVPVKEGQQFFATAYFEESVVREDWVGATLMADSSGQPQFLISLGVDYIPYDETRTYTVSVWGTADFTLSVRDAAV